MKRKILFVIVTIIIAFFAWFFLVYVRQANSEVLDAFGVMNEKLEQTNASAQSKIDSLQLKTGYSEYLDELKTLDELSNNLTSHIEYIKQELKKNIEDPTDYSKMSGTEVGDSFFFDDSGHSPEGQEFIEKIKTYTTGINNLFEENNLERLKSLDSKFTNQNNDTDWLEYNYKGFPLVAVLTNLTLLESDIKQINQEVINQILSQE